MQETGIKIALEKNVYKTGTLNFKIFNPEIDDYGETNAFADENRLLRFVSESRELSECAEELLNEFAVTYERMKQITIEFNGTQADYDTLTQALKRVNSSAQILLVPNFDFDPEYIIKKTNQAVEDYNRLVESDACKKLVEEAKEHFDIKIRVPHITKIDESEPPKELIQELKRRTELVEKAISRVKNSIGEMKNSDAMLQSRTKRYKKSLDYMTQDKFVDKLIAYSCDEKQREKYPLNPLILEQINDKVDYSEMNRYLFSSIYFESTFAQTVCNTVCDDEETIERFGAIIEQVREKVCARHKNKTVQGMSEVEGFTKELSGSFERALREPYREFLEEYLVKLWDTIGANVTHTMAHCLSCSEAAIRLPALNLSKEQLNDLIKERMKRIRNRYDDGVFKVFSSPRCRGVTGYKKTYEYSVNVEEYISYFTKGYVFGGDITDYQIFVIKQLRKAIINMAPLYWQNAKTLELNKTDSELLEKSKATLTDYLEQLSTAKNNISAILQIVDNEEVGDE